jgi:hypothetical protein
MALVKDLLANQVFEKQPLSARVIAIISPLQFQIWQISRRFLPDLRSGIDGRPWLRLHSSRIELTCAWKNHGTPARDSVGVRLGTLRRDLRLLGLVH